VLAVCVLDQNVVERLGQRRNWCKQGVLPPIE
jgi:hypothetical protein